MSKKKLNTENLESLGAPKLAELLMEISDGSAELKRRLRLELTHALGGDELIREVKKRLSALKRSKSYVDWRKRRALIKDLEIQRDMIVDKIAPTDPNTGFDLLWKFIELAPSTYERVDDSNGDVGDVFRYAITAFEDVSPNVQKNQKTLAAQIFDAMADNGYGEWDGLLGYVAPALTDAGLIALKSLIHTYETAEPDQKPSSNVITFGYSSPTSDRDWQRERKASEVKSWRQDIADLEGDIDGYIALYSDDDLLNPYFSARAATRLLSVDRNQEALDILVKSREAGNSHSLRTEWEKAYISALAALGKNEELHNFRWEQFEARLSIDYLRDLLKAMPDFEDIELEEKAKAIALKHGIFDFSLDFFLNWPDHNLAAELIYTRSQELNGDAYYTLTPAADQLQGEHPLAAVLCRRAMISYNLDNAKSTRYKHAMRHLMECESADVQIESYQSFLPHDEYMRDLRTKHPRKDSFWNGTF